MVEEAALLNSSTAGMFAGLLDESLLFQVRVSPGVVTGPVSWGFGIGCHGPGHQGSAERGS
jgi:hypothetical protein